ncbi:MAG: cytochrome c [Candidatus Omnitrophica bacterium]|nr:cytochrome c [Candidatus Omnitrophota bacterium]
MRSKFGIWVLMTAAIIFAGCTRDMRDDARLKPYEPSGVMADGRSAWRVPENTVPRGYLREDEAYFTGRANKKFVSDAPADAASRDLVRGRDIYGAFCALCHGPDGQGQGVMTEKGFPEGASFLDQRLIDAGDGYYYHVITNGFGRMKAIAGQITPEDRWSAVGAVREIQRKAAEDAS